MSTTADFIIARAAQIETQIEASLADIPIGAPIFLISPDTDGAAAGLFVRLHTLVAVDIPEDGESAIRERNRAVLVLHSINKFLERAWQDQRRPFVQRYLLKLSQAIEQLNDGVTHPLLVANITRRGRPDDLTETWKARSHACAALYCFEHDGRDMKRHTESLGVIAQKIAKDAPDLKRAMRTPKGGASGGDRTAKEELVAAILSWRRAFTQKEAPEIAQASWQHSCELADNEAAGDPRKYAEQAQIYLAVARDAARALMIRSQN